MSLLSTSTSLSYCFLFSLARSNPGQAMRMCRSCRLVRKIDFENRKQLERTEHIYCHAQCVTLHRPGTLRNLQLVRISYSAVLTIEFILRAPLLILRARELTRSSAVKRHQIASSI
jgi:hypothetical protein